MRMIGGGFGLLIFMVVVMRSWSAMRSGITSDFSTRSGLLVMITSSSVAEVEVTRVGPFMICVNLFCLIIRDSLLFALSKLSFRSPRIKMGFLRMVMSLTVSVI